MTLIPNRFLVRVEYAIPYVTGIPAEGDELVELPESARIDEFAALDDARRFAEVRMGWNEFGLGLTAVVSGKSRAPEGAADRPRLSDGLTVWLDTRDARAGHRATRYCHQFHFLPTGGGPERDEPVFVQSKIHRASEDAPLHAASEVPFRSVPVKGGYRLEAFLPAAVLNGFDPEQNPRLGLCYAVRDAELGEQVLGSGADFPYAEDPSLWSVVALKKKS
jgi:hypothetical protein